jgi:hypothetical protein
MHIPNYYSPQTQVVHHQSHHHHFHSSFSDEEPLVYTHVRMTWGFVMFERKRGMIVVFLGREIDLVVETGDDDGGDLRRKYWK